MKRLYDQWMRYGVVIGGILLICVLALAGALGTYMAWNSRPGGIFLGLLLALIFLPIYGRLTTMMIDATSDDGSLE